MAEPADDDGFLQRWSRRKSQVRGGQAQPAAPAAGTAADAPLAPTVAAPPAAPAAAHEAAPPPTLDDAAQLTPASDFTRFMAADVDGPVRNAALRRLFSDPHFNVMDGLDTYIDDYGKPDPLSPATLRRMVQAEFLDLFADAKTSPPTAPAQAEEALPDEDPDLRLQPHDAAGPAGAEPGAGTDAGREH